jgi:hypothetical protein
MQQIGRPRIERGAVDVVPTLQLPRAEVHLLPARVRPQRRVDCVCEPFGDRRAARERARPDLLRQRRAQRRETRTHRLRTGVRRFRERHVAAPVAHAALDADGRMANQDDVHPSTTR